MDLQTAILKRQIALETSSENEQLEILNSEEHYFYDEETKTNIEFLRCLASNDCITENVQFLLSMKRLDTTYETQRLREYIVTSKKLYDSAFTAFLGQKDIFTLFFMLEHVKLSDNRKDKIIQQLGLMGISEISDTNKLYKHLQDYKFSEEVQTQILDHEYCLDNFIKNPYLTDAIQLKIVNSEYFEYEDASIVKFIGSNDDEDERYEDEDFVNYEDYLIIEKSEKVYLYEKFAELCPNICETALIELCRKKNNAVLYNISLREKLPKAVILSLIENSNLSVKKLKKNALFLETLTTKDLLANVIKKNVFDNDLQSIILALKEVNLYLILAEQDWIGFETLQYLIDLDQIEILDRLISSNSKFIKDELKSDLEEKFQKHPEYSNYMHQKEILF